MISQDVLALARQAVVEKCDRTKKKTCVYNNHEDTVPCYIRMIKDLLEYIDTVPYTVKDFLKNIDHDRLILNPCFNKDSNKRMIKVSTILRNHNNRYTEFLNTPVTDELVTILC